jgi:hypothetical protein
VGSRGEPAGGLVGEHRRHGQRSAPGHRHVVPVDHLVDGQHSVMPAQARTSWAAASGSPEGPASCRPGTSAGGCLAGRDRRARICAAPRQMPRVQAGPAQHAQAQGGFFQGRQYEVGSLRGPRHGARNRSSSRAPEWHELHPVTHTASPSVERTAIVTGAARGIGAAAAERPARDGLAVAVIALDEADCAGTVEAIRSQGRSGSSSRPR